MKRFKKGFTLAEVLITLAIIGVVAAISIPSVISNTQQQEFKTGLRKAVSVLNSAITMNMAIDGESPYDNANLFGYLTRHMNIIKTEANLPFLTGYIRPDGTLASYGANSAFYTADGMRFEFDDDGQNSKRLKLHESSISPCIATMGGGDTNTSADNTCGGCGSYGLNSNSDGTTKPPCVLLVDINGDKRPNPANINCNYNNPEVSNVHACSKPYKTSDVFGIKLTDLFTIMITDKQAIPFGVAAQRAMYQAQAKK